MDCVNAIVDIVEVALGKEGMKRGSEGERMEIGGKGRELREHAMAAGL